MCSAKHLLWGVVSIGLSLVALAQPAETDLEPGNAYLEQGRYADAISFFGTLIAEHDDWGTPYRKRGVARLLSGDANGALQDFVRATELDSTDVEAWVGRSAARLGLADAESARADADEAVRLDPSSVPGLINRAAAALELEDAEAARQDLDTALTLEPDNRQAAINLSQAETRLGAFGRALDRLDGILTDDPEAETALTVRAETYMRLGQYEAAAADYDRLIALDPQNAAARNNRALVDLARADLETARSAFEQVLEEDPDNLRARENIDRLNTRTERLAKHEAPPTVETQFPEDQLPDAPVEPPVLEFKASEVCTQEEAPGPAVWQGGTELEVIELPGVEPVDLEPLPDVAELSQARFGAAVSVAMETMRQLYGPLTPKEQASFESMWVPLFGFPSQDVIDYLNQLNPLLARFVAGRDALARAAGAFQASMLEVAVALGYGAEEEAQHSLDLAREQTQQIVALHGGLSRIAAQIQALGNPPDPRAAFCEARNRHRKAVEALGEPVLPEGVEGVWDGILVPKGVSLDENTTPPAVFAEIEQRLGLPVGRVDAIVHAHESPPYPYHVVIRLIEDAQYEFMNHEIFEFYAYQHPSGAKGYNIECNNSDTLDSFQPVDGGLIHENKEFSHSYSIAEFRAALSPAGSEEILPGWRQSDAQVLRGFLQAIDARIALEASNPDRDYQTSFESWYTLNHERDFRVLYDIKEGALADIEKYQRDLQAFHTAGRLYLSQPSDCAGFLEMVDKEKANWVAGSDETSQVIVDATKQAEQDMRDRTDRVKTHERNIAYIDRILPREREALAAATDPKAREAAAWRVLQLVSDKQAEMDLIASLKTNRLVHTRSPFDAYAHNRLVRECKEEAARSDACLRIARGGERLIRLLPEDMQRDKLEQFRRIMDPQTLAKGDLERARRAINALNNQVSGYWEGQRAINEELAVAAEETEFYFKTGVMAVGMLVVGISGPAFAETFGETAALTVWAPNITGFAYGGMTGFVEGGPVEGVKQSIKWSGTLGNMAIDFVDGVQRGLTQKDATWSSALGQGATNLATAFVIGEAFKFCANVLGRGAKALLGRDIVLVGGRPSLARQFDNARYQQEMDDARSLIRFYQQKEFQLAAAQGNGGLDITQVRGLQQEVRQLAASINSSFHCKWLLKYQGSAGARRAFNSRVSELYDDMMPGLFGRLKRMGYDVSNIRLSPMRNASSSGSVSMDLDLALQEPEGLTIRKNGEVVSVGEFMKDAQHCMNRAYHEVSGVSASRSALNLTTSLHVESFSDPRLLEEGVDFTQIDPKDIAKIGKVLKVKTNAVQDDPVLSEVAKIQGRCRESTKEIDNMLMGLLDSKIKNAPNPAKAAEYEQIKAHWKGVRDKLHSIGMVENDPHRLWELEQELRMLTGGSNLDQVLDELTHAFPSLSTAP